ncbi:uncharacterized protein [Misgurnus anguillicaudatus]|uniref:uncharacterized protein isoform X2 n=1 Tax=Misgurnus anguillicaudatus TaxID=75329 RepID=UPI003CCF7621
MVVCTFAQIRLPIAYHKIAPLPAAGDGPQPLRLDALWVSTINEDYRCKSRNRTNNARRQTTKMPTLKDCYTCREKIGVASKTCPHCRAKQPYKQMLEKKKKQLSQEWIDRQKKNCSVNKIYDSTNLLLHKWELLERYPVLLLARRTSNGFSAECFCPWKNETEDTQDAFLTIKRLYESLLNVAIADKEVNGMGESSVTNGTETPPANSTPPSTCNVAIADKEVSGMGESSVTITNGTETPPADSTPLSTCNVANADKAASSMEESPATNNTQTPPADSTADSDSELTHEPVTFFLPPESSFLASPDSFTTPSPMPLSIAPLVSPQTHPVFKSSQSSSVSSSPASPLPPTSTLSTCSKLSTELGSLSPVSSSRKKGQIKRKADPKECPMHEESTSFPYKKILRKRIREGHTEVLVQWHPCSGCGKKWKNSWEPSGNIQSLS